MATVTAKSFDLVESAETTPVLRSIDPTGQVARRPSIVQPIFDIATLQGTISQTQRGTTMTKPAPVLIAGDSSTRFKKVHGPDDMVVDPVTGVATWVIPAGERGQAHNMSIKAYNGAGSALVSWVEIVKATAVDVGVYRVGPTQTYTTVNAARVQMSAGDVMVLDPAIYRGVENALLFDNGLPGGTADQMTTMIGLRPPWTDLQAAILDGEHTNNMIRVAGNYINEDWVAQGETRSGVNNYDYIKYSSIVIKDDHGSCFLIGNSQYSYLKYCIGWMTGHPPGSQVAFRNANYSKYSLVEDCMWLGGGVRYTISAFKSSKYIARRNIVRHGHYGNPNNSLEGAEPIGGISVYLMRDAAVDNNLIVDSGSDTDKFWINYVYMGGAINNPCTGYENWSSGITTDRNVAVDCSYGAYSSSQRESPSIQIHNDLVAVDMLMIGLDAGATAPVAVNNSQGPCDNFNHTYVLCQSEKTSDRGVLAYNYHQRSEYNNSIFHAGYVRANGINGAALYNGEWFDGSTLDPSAEGSIGCSVNDSIMYNPENQPLLPPGSPPYEENVNEITGVNPFTSGLDYPQWISEDSALMTAGPASSRVGAQCVTYKGKAGTFWGEAGYDQETTIPMWPHPLEEAYAAWVGQIPDYTGPTRSGNGRGVYGAVDTLPSKRGTAADGMSVSSYICRKLGAATPQFNCLATVNGANVVISWEPLLATEDRDKTVGYQVYRGDANGDNGVLLTAPDLTSTVFSFTDTPGAGTHSYWVLRRDTSRGYSKRMPGVFALATVV